ncbi:MAG: hypothetical protein H6672_02470 [Anaerolineaceae bacterium]|nr:hypothetical protein [Anaerolineaceae bacterium]
MRTLKITLLLVIVGLFLAVMWTSTSLAGSGFTAINITPGPTPTQTFTPNPPIPTLTPEMGLCNYDYYEAILNVSFLADGDDEGSGYDWTAAVARRPNGTVLSVRYYLRQTTRTYNYTSGYTYHLGATSFTGIAWLEVYDITYVPTVAVWPVPNSEFSRIIANAPTPVVRVKFDPADYVDPRCPHPGLTDDDSAPLPPDERLNWQQGDLTAVVYAASDSSGAPALHVYGVNADSQGYFLASVTQADLAPYRNAPLPAHNTVIKTLGENVTLYRLVSGEFALVIGPDAEGKNWQVIFDDIPWTTLKHEQFDPGA